MMSEDDLAAEIERETVAWADRIAEMLARHGVRDTSAPLALGLVLLAARIFALAHPRPSSDAVANTVRALYELAQRHLDACSSREPPS